MMLRQLCRLASGAIQSIGWIVANEQCVALACVRADPAAPESDAGPRSLAVNE